MQVISTTDSTVYRHIEQLKLRPEIEKLAKELINQIDMPVVFEINYQGDHDYGRRHPVYHNQFWVQIRTQDETSEFERLVLHLLYMGVLERRRIVMPMVLDKHKIYLESLENEIEREGRIKGCKNMLGGLVSLAVTMEANLYLKQYGIDTSSKVKEEKFLVIYHSLQDYIKIQSEKFGFCWYDETALSNIIDMSRICWMNKRYHNKIQQVMKKIKPRKESERYIYLLNRLTKMLYEISNDYESEIITDVSSSIVERAFEILQMNKFSYLKKEYYMRRECEDFDGTKTVRYAFIPEDIDRKEELIRGLRYLNTGLLLLEEYYGYFREMQIPDPHVSILKSDTIQGWADGNKEKGYHITITTGLILLLYDTAKRVDLLDLNLESCRLAISDEEIRDRLYRYALFYVIAHEYVHILHGDCDKSVDNINEKMEQEENANKGAYYLVKKLLFMQYRPLTNDEIKEQQRFFLNYACDQLIFMAARIWCDKVTRRI